MRNIVFINQPEQLIQNYMHFIMDSLIVWHFFDRIYQEDVKALT